MKAERGMRKGSPFPTSPIVGLWSILLLAVVDAGGAEKPFQVVASEHYVIQTDVPAKTVGGAIRVVESVYGELAECFGISRVALADSERIRIRLFSDRKGFDAHAAGHAPMYVGYRGYATTEEIVALMPESSDEAVGLLVHEICHKLLHQVIQRPPPWFNEGLACYYSTYRRRFGLLRFGQMHEARALAFRKALRTKTHVPLGPLLRLKPGEFYRDQPHPGRTDQSEALSYTESWALVYFLLNAPGKEYRGKFGQYFERLKRDENSVDAFGQVYGPDLDKVEREWISYFWNR